MGRPISAFCSLGHCVRSLGWFFLSSFLTQWLDWSVLLVFSFLSFCVFSLEFLLGFSIFHGVFSMCLLFICICFFLFFVFLYVFHRFSLGFFFICVFFYGFHQGFLGFVFSVSLPVYFVFLFLVFQCLPIFSYTAKTFFIHI